MIISDNLLERGWELYRAAQHKIGQDVDEPSFVGGFVTCFAMLTGRVNIGHTAEQPMTVLRDRLDHDIGAVLRRIETGEGQLNLDNLIQRGWSVFERSNRTLGMAPDEPSFVGGFATCFGIVFGRLDVGFPGETSVLDVFNRLQRDLNDNRDKIVTVGKRSLN